MTRASGADDPALAETSWPFPDVPTDDRDSIEWRLRYGHPSRADLLAAADILAAYGALVKEGTTTRQTERLAALRRVWRRKR